MISGEVNMSKVYNVLLLSVHAWLESLVLSSWALQSGGKDVFLLNPDFLAAEKRALKQLADRLPCRFTAAPGLEEAAASLAPDLGQDILPEAVKGFSCQQLRETFGEPQGLIFAPAASREDCLMGAVLAVRLGFALLPYSSREDLDSLLSETASDSEINTNTGLPLSSRRLVLTGTEIPLKKEEDSPLYANVTFLTGKAATLDYLRKMHSDYFLIVNSADMAGPQREGTSLGDMKVKGLSLLAPLMASYRDIFAYDAAAVQPKAEEIEEQVNELIGRKGFTPKYKAILASPGYIPFIVAKNYAIGSYTEELVRDIHIRLNDDLFYDVAEGRLFQSTPGGLSLQLLSTKYYHDLKKPENNALIVTTPHVEKGIIFSTDDALIDCQLQPLLEEAGLEVTLLARKESNARQVAAALKDSAFFLYAGHGGPETLNTHGHYLARKDLSLLPPMVAYASACSTTYMRPHLFSQTDGLDWEEIHIWGRDIIGLAMVEMGALCFVGGATTEDLQYSTSIYGIFMEALLVKGCSVGEALLATQNFISFYSQILLQKAPQAWRNYTYGTANALHQQILLGDPALTPCPGEKGTAFPRVIQELPEGGGYSIQVDIPAHRWRRAKADVNPGKPSRSYYKSRETEVISPFGAGVVSWGDFYPVAPDAEGITDTALMSSFLHLTLDLPPGTAPVDLRLEEAAAGQQECLVCGKETPADREALSLFKDYRLPFLMLPPLRMDMREGWPYALEERGDSVRLHWLVPLLVIDDRARTAHKAEKFTFMLKTAPGGLLKGRVKASGFKKPGSLVVAAGLPLKDSEGARASHAPETREKEEKPGEEKTAEEKTPQIYTLAQTLTREDGSFQVLCARTAEVIAVDREFPLYELPFGSSNFSPDTWKADFAKPVQVTLTEGEYSRLQGKVVDSLTAKPIKGAVLRAWRGKFDPGGDPLLDAFCGEVTTGVDGNFILLLPPGDYILYAAARAGEILYKSCCLALSLEDSSERHKVLVMDQAAIVRGRISFTGEPLPFPATVKVRRYPEKESIETLSMVPVRTDGTFACIVGFQDRFSIVVEEEGRPPVRDSNNGKGYKLNPGEILEREYEV